MELQTFCAEKGFDFGSMINYCALKDINREHGLTSHTIHTGEFTQFLRFTCLSMISSLHWFPVLTTSLWLPCVTGSCLYSWSVSPSHERVSVQSLTSWRGTEVISPAQQLDIIDQPPWTTERDCNIHLYIRRQWHIFLTCVNVTRTNKSKATSVEQCVDKLHFSFYLAFKIKAGHLIKCIGMNVLCSDVTADYLLINIAYIFT